jgi:DNA-binding response OmpR family regulator
VAGELILVIDDSATIAKAVQLVLARDGYRVEIASDGEEGLVAARRQTPDLILLDFVMPRMNGYQVCLELAADPELSSVPVVLMSARGDQVGERFVKMMGIVEYVTKPFSSETLASVVTRVLGRPASGPPPHATIDDTIDGLDEPSPSSGSNAGIAVRPSALARLREELMAVIAARVIGHARELASPVPSPSPSPMPVPSPSPTEIAARQALLDEVRASLDDATLARVLDDAEASGGEGDLRGDLRVIPLPEIFQLLDTQALSGLLMIQRGSERIEVHLRRGQVEQALGRGLPDELRLGRFVLDRELVDDARFQAFLQARAAEAPKVVASEATAASTNGSTNSALIGQQLVAHRLITAADLRTVLARQSSELVYEALRWRTGWFRFRAGLELPPVALEANLALAMEALIQEGCRRVDEWHLIERLIDTPEAVFARDEAASPRSRPRLSREEQLVLDRVDGSRRVADLVSASRLGSFEVSRALYRMLSIKLVRRAD